MRYLSVCSGIEAATVAWHHMGWEPAAFADIEAFPSAVLAHHYPSVPNLGDMTKFKEWDIGAIDLLVGGTPCQSFSVAGLRKGLEDPRGNLALTFLAIADHYKPQWVVWENVPGVLSSNGGKDVTSFLDGLEELGYIIDCDILDARFHGVPQRRRRVFVCAQHRDYLLQNKTTTSALTIAQCWQEILLSLLARVSPASGKGRKVLDLPYLSNDGAKRRMKLFGLDGETGNYDTLRKNLVEAFRKHPQEPSASDVALGKLEKEPTQGDLLTGLSQESLSILTEQSLKEALDESYAVMKSCITLTPTSSITTSQIYTCFQAVLATAKLIQRLNPSSPPFWSAATSALTSLQEYMNYARQTNSQLSREVGGVSDWSHILEQARRTNEALGHIRVGSFGKVLPLSESLRGDFTPSKETRQRAAPTVVQGPPYSRTGNERVECDAIVPVADPAYCLETTCHDYSRADGFNMLAQAIPIQDQATRFAGKRGEKQDGKGNGLGVGSEGDPCFTLTKGDKHAVAYSIREDAKANNFSATPLEVSTALQALRPSVQSHHAQVFVAQTTVYERHDQDARLKEVNVSPTLHAKSDNTCDLPVVLQPMAFTTEQTPKFNQNQALTLTKQSPTGGGQPQAVMTNMAVRRLTPTECERLQGFPDGYTQIPWRKKDEAPDSLRYKALGNSMAVPVMRWIGERINQINNQEQ